MEAASHHAKAPSARLVDGLSLGVIIIREGADDDPDQVDNAHLAIGLASGERD